MKKLRQTILLITCSLSISYSQSYYPLEINNRWDYFRSGWEPGGYSYSDSFSVRVIGDTVMPNNKQYYCLSGSDITGFWGGFNFVRVDSNYVCYYIDSQEVPFYKLDATVGEQWTANIDILRLESIDSTYIFNTFTRLLVYRVDGLILRWVTLSDKFGPLSYSSTGEPPGTNYENIGLIGCVLSNIQYGTLLGIFKSSQQANYFDLFQNYPNPFNNNTIIQYEIYEAMNLEITLYNVTGERVKSLYKGYQLRGIYKVLLNASELATGLYIYALESDKRVLYKKCFLIR